MRRVLALTASVGVWFAAYFVGSFRSSSAGSFGALLATLLTAWVAALLSRRILSARHATGVGTQLLVAYIGGCLYRAAFLAFILPPVSRASLTASTWLLVLGVAVGDIPAFAWFFGTTVLLQSAVVVAVHLWAVKRSRSVGASHATSPL